MGILLVIVVLVCSLIEGCEAVVVAVFLLIQCLLVIILCQNTIYKDL